MNYFPKKISIQSIWKRFQTQKSFSDKDITSLLQPESKLEKQLIQSKVFKNGLFWGKPRFGHPEGKVIFHIQEVLQNIEKIPTTTNERAQLRLIALTHDTFKYIEDRSKPRDWTKHHSVLAKNYLQNHIDDQAVLDIIETHDDVFHAWILSHRGNEEKSKIKLDKLITKLGDNLELYYKFFLADTRTGDKIQTPVTWFEQEANLNAIKF